MKLAVVGGGPAGLYFALLIKQARPEVDITVLERNRRDDTFGWGVVFSDQTMENFRAADAITFDQITASLAHWDDIDVHVRDRVITSSGHGFSGIARKKLLNILQARCEALGVTLQFQADLRDDAASLATGWPTRISSSRPTASTARCARATPRISVRTSMFGRPSTSGSARPFPSRRSPFISSRTRTACSRRIATDSTPRRPPSSSNVTRPPGEARASTVSICRARSRRAKHSSADGSTGTACRSNALPTAAPWTSFVRVRNRSWFHDNIVLIGDAAHTAHFSIGSGTKLAMEDAIALARVLAASAPTAEALSAYQSERMTEALRLQNAARNSMEWFENVKRYIRLEPEQFTYSLLTRSQRVSHENLRLRDPAYLQGVERWFAAGDKAKEAGVADKAAAPPPMFTPYALRGMTLANRIVVAPMDMYCADDGTPGDFHLVHLGARALGGAGLIITEMACVSPEARITRGCAGMYSLGTCRLVATRSWSSCIGTVRPGSACSWVMPDPRDRPGSHGRAATLSSTTIPGRWSRRQRFATRPPCRCPAR